MKKAIFASIILAISCHLKADVMKYSYTGVIKSVQDTGQSAPAFILPEGVSDPASLVGTVVSGDIYVQLDKLPQDSKSAENDSAYQLVDDASGFARSTMLLEATGQEFVVAHRRNINQVKTVLISNTLGIQNDWGYSSNDSTFLNLLHRTTGYQNELNQLSLRVKANLQEYRGSADPTEVFSAPIDSEVTQGSRFSVIENNDGGANDLYGVVNFDITSISTAPYEGHVEVPTEDPINFNLYDILSYGQGQDVNGSYTIEDNGNTLTLTGNTWKAIPVNYQVTENTVLEFEFSSSAEGEIHGIGLDSDMRIQPERTFQVYGTQMWGRLNFNNSMGVSRTYRIPVGEYYSGPMQYLFFTMDNDRSPNSGNSVFRNVVLYEVDQ